MSKERTLLSDISVLFTEETLEEILRTVSGKQEIKILSWDFGKTKKEDGCLSVMNKIKVYGEAANRPIEISLVVKSMPKNLGARKTFRFTESFYNEITCYTEIFPKFQEFLKSKGQEDLLVIPRCLAAITDGNNDYLVLEDVNVLGFYPVTRQHTLTFSECSLMLKALAKFHAISFAYKDQDKKEFQRLAEKLLEVYFAPRLYNWYKGFQALVILATKDALAREYPGSKAEERFNAWSGQELYNKSTEFCSRINACTSVISQGDSWAPNFLIREPDGENPIALALDFQMARCASPVLDISYFIFTATEKSLRDNHYEKLLKLYHDELIKSISLLGSNPQRLYPWDVFMKEVQEQSLHGIHFSLEAVPVLMLPPGLDGFNIDVFKGDQVIEISKICNVKPIKSKEGRLRLAEIVVDAVEKNYL